MCVSSALHAITTADSARLDATRFLCTFGKIIIRIQKLVGSSGKLSAVIHMLLLTICFAILYFINCDI